MLGVYEAFTVIVFGSGKGLSQLLGLCAGIAAIAGGSVLLFTVPMMAVKANQ
jgi:predicted ABC-type transport system involved in lysophospholipase L1 biosynthesis ATPase subunit